jgi:anti-anti-sigma regulatory factor
MKFYLIVAKGRKKGFPIPITGDLFLIGSDRMCQVRKRTLGGRHCAFVTRNKKVFVRDLDSGQNTMVNGEAIPSGAEWPVFAGDLVTVGPLEFQIQFREKALSQKDTEEWAARSLDVRKEEEVDEEPSGEAPITSSRHVSAADAASSILHKLNEMKGAVKDRLRISVFRGITVVSVIDMMLLDDSEVAATKKALCDNLSRHDLRVLLDLKNVRKLSSSALTMLGDVNRWLIPRGSKLAFCRIRPDLESAMAMFRVDKVPVFADKFAAADQPW